ncbi:MAG: Ltp family lipoprotein [Saccharofermentanales bacterium]
MKKGKGLLIFVIVVVGTLLLGLLLRMISRGNQKAEMERLNQHFGDKTISTSVKTAKETKETKETTKATTEATTKRTTEVTTTEKQTIQETIQNTTETSATLRISQEYRNALDNAEFYAEDMHMSKQAIYDILTSEYGNKFQPDAAQWAVDELDERVDWNDIALESAKFYYQEMSMSKQGVYDQLISEYGEQFTQEQAQYAIDNLE